MASMMTYAPINRIWNEIRNKKEKIFFGTFFITEKREIYGTYYVDIVAYVNKTIIPFAFLSRRKNLKFRPLLKLNFNETELNLMQR